MTLVVENFETLICPFCRIKISAMDDTSHLKSKEFMGKHLALNHQKEMERVLRKLENKTSGFKKGL